MALRRGRRGVSSPDSRPGGCARRRCLCRAVALFALGAGLALGSLQASAFSSSLGPEQVGEWGPLLSWPTQGKHLILMPTNKVLVWPTGTGAYVWNPATGEFTPVPATFGNVHCAGHGTLADGSPIVVGGEEVNSTNGIKVTATFDPVTETWTNRTPMKYARWYPTVTILGDGRVLAVSGRNESGSISTIPEIYDPQTDAWTELTGASRNQPVYPFMYLLPNGEVFDAAPRAATQYLDVSGSGSWSPGPVSGWDNGSGSCCSESGPCTGSGRSSARAAPTPPTRVPASST